MLPLHPSSSYFSLGTGHCITFWMHLQNIFCNLDPLHLQWRTASRASLAMLSSSSSVMVSLVTVTCPLFRRSLSLVFIRLETCLVILTICILTGRMFGALLSVYDCCGWSWWPHIYNLAPPPPPSTGHLTPPHWAHWSKHPSALKTYNCGVEWMSHI